MKHDLSSVNTPYILYAPYVQLHMNRYVCTDVMGSEYILYIVSHSFKQTTNICIYQRDMRAGTTWLDNVQSSW